MSYSSEKRRLERRQNAAPARQIAEEIRSRPERGPKAWAWNLKRREEAGEKLSDQQKAAWRLVLGEK